ncbi:MFS transporter [Planctomicrobium sp. SH661]|uniref:MFS transporter n=1 Tax=Planctomicrobium sp. SH661 TaxID=3448124 RepID=UPI003F5C7D8B
MKPETRIQPTAPTAARNVVLVFLLILAAIAYLDRVCISTASLAIQRDLGITKTQMGTVFSAFILCYAVFEVPGGWLADRFGPRLILARIVFAWSLMTALTGAAIGFVSLLTVRALFGVGEAGMFPSSARVITRWFPKSQHGRVFGLMLMTATLGGAAAQPLSIWLQELITWRWMFVVFATAGVFWAVAWYLWFRNDPHDHPAVNDAELELIGTNPPEPHPPIPWAQFQASRNLWMICLMYFSTIYGTYFYLTWLPEYLQTSRGMELRAAGWWSALAMISMAVGNVLGGWLSDVASRWFGRRYGRRLPGLIGLPTAAVSVGCAMITTNGIASALLFAAAAGLISLGVPPAWAVCLDIGSRYAGVVSGIMTTCGCLGGAISTTVVGLCLDHYHSYEIPLGLNAISSLVAAFAWWVIDPDRPVTNEET